MFNIEKRDLFLVVVDRCLDALKRSVSLTKIKKNQNNSTHGLAEWITDQIEDNYFDANSIYHHHNVSLILKSLYLGIDSERVFVIMF